MQETSRDVGSSPGPGRSGGEHGNPLQYPCPENPMNRGTWQATVHRVTKNWTQLKTLGVYTHTWPLTENVCQPFLWMPGKCHRMLSPQNQGPLTDLASRSDLDCGIPSRWVQWTGLSKALGLEQSNRSDQHRELQLQQSQPVSWLMTGEGCYTHERALSVTRMSGGEPQAKEQGGGYLAVPPSCTRHCLQTLSPSEVNA